MISFPLSLWDLTVWLAVMTIILLTASEMFSQYYARINIYVNRKRLRKAALGVSILFLGTVVIRIITLLLR